MANPSRRIIEAFLRYRPSSSPLTQIPSNPISQNPYLSSSYISSSPRNPLLTIISRRRTYSSSSSSSSSSSIFPVVFSNSRNLLASSEIPSSLPSFHDTSSTSKLTSPNTVFSLIFSRKHHSHTPPLTKSSPSSSSSSSVGFPNSIRFLTSHNFLAFSPQRLGFNYGCSPSGYYRHFCFKSNFNGNFTKTVVDKPLSAIRSAFVRYREAVGLQIEAFWRRNYLALLGVGAFGLCMLLWRIMFGIADTFIGFSEGMAKYGFLALSSAIVAFAGLYVRSRFTINPDKVYRIAMRRLNTSAEILEVMGAPLSGTDLRAYVMSAGGLRLKNFKPKLGGKRCFLIFPIRGSERKGLVSVEVKKKKGQYDMKLLAVDIPMTTGPDQRFFLIGDEEEYKVGGGLISELRDPIVKAMAAVKEFEALDQKEEEEDEERELEEAERKNREEIDKLEKGS